MGKCEEVGKMRFYPMPAGWLEFISPTTPGKTFVADLSASHALPAPSPVLERDGAWARHSALAVEPGAHAVPARRDPRVHPAARRRLARAAARAARLRGAPHDARLRARRDDARAAPVRGCAAGGAAAAAAGSGADRACARLGAAEARLFWLRRRVRLLELARHAHEPAAKQRPGFRPRRLEV